MYSLVAFILGISILCVIIYQNKHWSKEDGRIWSRWYTTDGQWVIQENVYGYVIYHYGKWDSISLSLNDAKRKVKPFTGKKSIDILPWISMMVISFYLFYDGHIVYWFHPYLVEWRLQYV